MSYSGSDDESYAYDSYDDEEGTTREEIYEEAKSADRPKQYFLTGCRTLSFFILAFAFSPLAFMVLQYCLKIQAIFPADFDGRELILGLAAICAGCSCAAWTTFACSYALRRCMGVKSGFDDECYNLCPRLLILFAWIFGTMAAGIVFGWVVFVPPSGLYNPIAWACIMAFGWSALGIFVGSCWTRMWHILYIMFFLANFFTWPIVCRFTITAPKATNLWDEDYPPFPRNDPQYLRKYPLGDETKSISLSEVPASPRACNFSCFDSDANAVNQANMNFPVSMSVDNKNFGERFNSHVLYPVLLMSADFKNWHVAADRNSAFPQHYFRQNTEFDGLSYRTVVPATLSMIETSTTTPVPVTAAPAINYVINPASVPVGGRRLPADEPDVEEDGAPVRVYDDDYEPGDQRRLQAPGPNTTTTPEPVPTVNPDSYWLRPNVGTYIVACVVNTESKLKANKDGIKSIGEITTATTTTTLAPGPRRLEELRRLQETGNDVSTSTLMALCDSIGGVCGYPCNQKYIEETPLPQCLASGEIDLKTAFPGRTHPNVDIKIQSCVAGTASGTTPAPGSITPGSPDNCQSSTAPFSAWVCPSRGLPAMQVVARNIVHDSTENIRPHVFMFATTADNFAAGMANPALAGGWQRYNRFTVYDTQASTAELYPGYPMTLIQDNKVTMRPDKCYTKAGPLYMVACAINASAYDAGVASNDMNGGHVWSGQFKVGQKVAPPPFNDRCVAVSGRCGLACQKWNPEVSGNSPLVGTYCKADGVIPQHYLVGELPIQTNDHWIVYFMVFVLILGYWQRVLSGLAGLFSIYPQAHYYKSQMTEHFRYITIATPSIGEDKMCVMRNIIGTTSGYPSGCAVPYHIIFLDESRRHPFKGLFMAYAAAIGTLVQKCNAVGGTDTLKSSEKMDQFMKAWVKDTRDLKLEDETDRYYKVRRAPEAYDDEDHQKEVDEITAHKEGVVGYRRDRYFREHPKQLETDKKLLSALAGETAWKKVWGEEAFPDTFKAFKDELETYDPSKTKYTGTKVSREEDDIEEAPFNKRVFSNTDCRKGLKFHYLGRAKHDKEDDTINDTQHVTVGMPYYTLDQNLGANPSGRSPEVKESIWATSRRKNWKVMQAHTDYDEVTSEFKVPIATSRGKAGALNFAANYLYLWHLNSSQSGKNMGAADEEAINREADWDPDDIENEPTFRPGLFSISDARHQYQPAFMTSCIPYFFKPNSGNTVEVERDPEVAFTQVPQFFPEIIDDKDFLDNNNAMYFRINGTIRNCCGGASSCGANGTWQLNDPRDDHKRYGLEKEYFIQGHHGFGEDAFHPEWNEGYVWEIEENPHIDTQEECSVQLGPRKQLKERSIFHESCKIEDTASSLNAILRGQRSQYVNMRLSYAMTKAPVSYLAAVQRWAEGAVVLMLQTYIDMPIHTKRPCLSKLANLLVLMAAPAFILWTMFYVYGSQYDPWALLRISEIESLAPVRDYFFGPRGLQDDFAEFSIVRYFAPSYQEHITQLFLLPLSAFSWWIAGIIWFVCIVFWIPTTLYCCCRMCLGKNSTPVWPHEMSAWARLAIIMDNLTYWLFFFTAFWWVFFNAYTAFSEFLVSFSTKYFYLVLIIFTSLFHYAQLVISMIRAQNVQRDEGNAVLSITLDNLWRQTQLYYINAPLQLYAIVCGFADYFNQKSYGSDLSFWKGGDRGVFTTQVVQCWLSTIIILALTAVIWQFIRPDPNMTSVIATIILCLTAMDVLFPCIYLTCEGCNAQYKKDVAKYNRQKKEADEEEEELLAGERAPTRVVDGCCAPLARCFTCGQNKEQLPCFMRFVTCSWWGKTLYDVFCGNSCVVGFLKYVGVIKEFIVPLGVAVAIFAAGGDDGGSGSGILLQLVAAGFTGAH